MSVNSKSKIEKLAALVWVATVVSFGGYWFENLFVGVTLGYIDNRSMYLPFLLGYGLGVAALYLIFGTPASPRLFALGIRPRHKVWKMLYYAVVVFAGVSLGEAVLGTLMEEICNVTWWDYSSIPLSLGKFVSVPTSLGFTALVTAFMHFCFDPLYHLCLKIDRRVLYPLAAIFIIVLVADLSLSSMYMYQNQNFLRLWRWTIWQ